MADHSDDYEVDRSTSTPTRTDKRGLLHMLHDELGKAIGVGAAKDRKVNVGGGKSEGLMDAVDEAVKGAPDPGSEY